MFRIALVVLGRLGATVAVKVICTLESGIRTSLTAMLAGTISGICRLPKVIVWLIVKSMLMSLHTVLEKYDSEVTLKQTGVEYTI